jgi:hypothetical protein
VEPSAKGAPSSQKIAAGGPGNASSPLSFPPFGNPPFPATGGPSADPPSKLESTKGGETAGGTGTAACMARLKSPPGPQPQRSRAPPPFGFPDPLRHLSPLRQGPRGAGRVGRAGEGSFLTPPQPVMEFASSPFEKSGSSLSPRCAFSPPEGAGALVLRRRAGPARKSACKTRQGRSPEPPWRRACCPAAGNHSGRRDHQSHPGCHRQPQCAPSNEIQSLATLEAASPRQVPRRLRRPDSWS